MMWDYKQLMWNIATANPIYVILLKVHMIPPILITQTLWQLFLFLML